MVNRPHEGGRDGPGVSPRKVPPGPNPREFLMTLKRTVWLFSLTWVLGITFLHAWLNKDFYGVFAARGEDDGNKFRVGFIPVT
jgi:hypothetical protein